MDDIKSILKKSLTIVDELAKMDVGDLDVDKLEKLIKESKILKKDKSWKLY